MLKCQLSAKTNLGFMTDYDNNMLVNHNMYIV